MGEAGAGIAEGSTGRGGVTSAGKRWWRRWYTVTGGVVLALLILGGIFGDTGSGDETVEASATTSRVEATTTSAPTISTTTTTTAAPTSMAAALTTTAAAETTAAPTTTTVPTTTAAPPTTTARSPAVSVLTVTNVVDGDTVEVSSGERIRIIGIDAPEQGECGYAEAGGYLASLVAGNAVNLVAGAQDDLDRYDRLLRYLDTEDGIDVGLALIETQLAIGRYDSRDGYGRHDREDLYVAADQGVIDGCSTIPGGSADPNPTTTSGGGAAAVTPTTSRAWRPIRPTWTAPTSPRWSVWSDPTIPMAWTATATGGPARTTDDLSPAVCSSSGAAQEGAAASGPPSAHRVPTSRQGDDRWSAIKQMWRRALSCGPGGSRPSPVRHMGDVSAHPVGALWGTFQCADGPALDAVS